MNKIKVRENTDFVFPKTIQTIYYTNVMDLRMTSNYKQFRYSGFSKYLKSIDKCTNNLIIFDATGNIGCDAVNFHECFKDKLIFTCEIDKLKAECIKLNTKKYSDSIIVFNDNSTHLLKAFFQKDLAYLLKHIVSDNRQKLTSDIFKCKILYNIDPPFGEDYDKNKDECKLEFDKYDIIDYLKSIDDQYGENITQYILKAPLNFKIKQIYAIPETISELHMLTEFKMNFVNTKKSAFKYILLNSYELINYPKNKRATSKMSGGVLLREVLTDLKNVCEYNAVKRLINKYIKEFNLTSSRNKYIYSYSLETIDFNSLLSNILVKTYDSQDIPAILTNLLLGNVSYVFDDIYFQMIPIIKNYNISAIIGIYNCVKCMLLNKNITDNVLYYAAKIITINICKKEKIDTSFIYTSTNSKFNEIYEECTKLDITTICENLSKMTLTDEKSKIVDMFAYDYVNYLSYSLNEIVEVFKAEALNKHK